MNLNLLDTWEFANDATMRATIFFSEKRQHIIFTPRIQIGNDPELSIDQNCHPAEPVIILPINSIPENIADALKKSLLSSITESEVKDNPNLVALYQNLSPSKSLSSEHPVQQIPPFMRTVSGKVDTKTWKFIQTENVNWDIKLFPSSKTELTWEYEYLNVSATDSHILLQGMFLPTAQSNHNYLNRIVHNDIIGAKIQSRGLGELVLHIRNDWKEFYENNILNFKSK